MSVEIADAYISLYTKMPSVQRDISSALEKVDTEESGKKMGDGIGRGISSKQAALAGAVGGIFATLANVAIGSISGLVSEAVAASDATDKFKSTLDFSGIDTTTIESLTQGAQAYADATVYGLADIQNITAQLAANGVKDFDQLAEAAGNLNAVAGGNAETFKSVGMVLTQTAGQGKLTTENWNQLSDAIPGASGQIQKALLDNGAFVGNFRDEMAKGEITAQEFNEALLQLGTDPVAVEAATSTATLEGALGNLQATIVGGLADGITAIKPLLTDLIGGFASLLDGTFEFIGALSGGLDIGQFAEFASYLSPLGLIFKTLQPVLPQIVDAVGQLVGTLAEGLMGVVPVLLPVFSQLVTMIADLAAQVIPMLLPVLLQVQAVFASVLEAIVPIIGALAGALMPILEALIPVIITVLDAFLPLIAALVEALGPILVTIADVIGAILVPILDIAVNIIKLLAGVITWLVTEIISPYFTNILIPVIKQVGRWFEDVFGGLGDFFAGIWEGISDGFKAFINFIIDGLNGFLGGVNEVGNFISDITGGAVDMNIGKLPRLADGGIIPASTGGTAAVIGERGRDEAVLPLPEDWRTNGLSSRFSGDENITLIIEGKPFTAMIDKWGRQQAQILRAGARQGGRF